MYNLNQHHNEKTLGIMLVNSIIMIFVKNYKNKDVVNHIDF
jgi:hypothetical protein